MFPRRRFLGWFLAAAVAVPALLLIGADAQSAPTEANGTTTSRVECPDFCFCQPGWSAVSCTGVDTKTPAPDIVGVLGRTVQRLDFRNLLLPQLSGAQLRNVSRLRELSLVRCQLSRINDGAFRDSAALERLDLSQNLLTSLSQVTLVGLERLKSLDLSSNKLVHVAGVLHQLTSLEHLNLCQNALVSLTTVCFKGLYRLEFLNLDGNEISHVDADTFQELPNLAHLMLSHNPLTELHYLDLFAARPTYVDLSWTRLRRLPGLIARYIRHLRISGNDLGVVRRGDLESYGQVKLLVLENDQITEIEEDALGRMERLEELSLNDNLMTRIPASLPWPSLKTLSLEGNRIASVLAADLQGLDQLHHLSLARNLIEAIAMGAFDQLTSLKRLDLSRNRLKRVGPEMFYGLNGLQELDLSGNPIDFVEPMAFARLPAIQLSIDPPAKQDQNESNTTGSSTSALPTTQRPDWMSPVQPTERRIEASTLSGLPTTKLERTVMETGKTMASTAPTTVDRNPIDQRSPRQEMTGNAATAATNGGADISNRTGLVPHQLLETKPAQRNRSSSSVVWLWLVVSSAILIALMATASSVYCFLTKSRWARNRHAPVWPVKVNVKAHRKAEKDLIKMGWSVDDLDHWTASLSPTPPPPQPPPPPSLAAAALHDAEDDTRLLLAVVSSHRHDRTAA